MMDGEELLDRDAACRFLGGSKAINPSTLYRGIKRKLYPKPIKISPNGRRWLKSELVESRDRQIAARDAR